MCRSLRPPKLVLLVIATMFVATVTWYAHVSSSVVDETPPLIINTKSNDSYLSRKPNGIDADNKVIHKDTHDQTAPELVKTEHNYIAVAIDNTVSNKKNEDAHAEYKISTDIHKSPFIDRQLHVDTTGEIENKHTILMWNPPEWMTTNWYADVDFNQCSYKNCKMVHNKDFIRKSSVVVFSVGDTGMGFAPPVSPSERNPDQAWVFYSIESPVHLTLGDYKSPNWHNALNWSWTYRTDADIFHPYGILQTRLDVPKKNYTEIFRRKSKMAAWAVSHCGAYSKRDVYVGMMNQFTHVDIYGQCGQNYPEHFKELLHNDYKFYLGFENSLCHDYITEKLFNYYKSDIITVVRGKVDYSKYLPEGSYINAANFSTVKELADFMQKIGSNEEEYIKYLKIKDRYEVKERDFMFRDALCNICHKVNNLDKYRKTYADIVEWLGNCNSAQDLH